MKLYHYSNKKNLKTVKIKYFNSNSYTLNDYKHCKINRSFFYTELKPEKLLKNCKNIYYTQINKTDIYDLKTDNKNYISKYNTIENILLQVKNDGYKGILYNTGKRDIVNLFYNVNVKKWRRENASL